jgi:ABC-2 type transport system ATP-binding protein
VPVLASAPGVLDASLFGRALRVVVADAADAATSLRAQLEAAGLACRSIRQIAPSLEDVFVSRVRSAGGAVVG